MADLRTTLSNAARTGAATLLDIPDAIDRLVDFPDNGFGILGQLDDFTDGARAAFRDLLTPDPDGNPYGPGLPTPTIPPQQPAPPGQCPGEAYSVSATATAVGNNGVPDDGAATVSVVGPVFAAFVGLDQPSPSSSAIFGVLYIASQDVINSIQNPSNARVQRLLNSGNAPDGFFEAPDRRLTAWSLGISIFGPNEQITASSVNITRQDGLPDDCGVEPPPEPPFIDDPVTYDPPTGPPITISPVLTFNPIRITVNNTAIIPIGIVYNDVDITANLNLNIGSVEFNFGGGNGGGGDCCLPPQLPELPPADPDPEPDPGNESRISGVIITVTDISSDANFTAFQMPQGPTIYFPDLGLISFRVRIDGILSWTAPIRIQNRRQIIPVPWPEGAVDVAGLSRPGVNFTITVIYDDIAQLP